MNSDRVVASTSQSKSNQSKPEHKNTWEDLCKKEYTSQDKPAEITWETYYKSLRLLYYHKAVEDATFGTLGKTSLIYNWATYVGILNLDVYLDRWVSSIWYNPLLSKESAIEQIQKIVEKVFTGAYLVGNESLLRKILEGGYYANLFTKLKPDLPSRDIDQATFGIVMQALGLLELPFSLKMNSAVKESISKLIRENEKSTVLASKASTSSSVESEKGKGKLALNTSLKVEPTQSTPKEDHKKNDKHSASTDNTPDLLSLIAGTGAHLAFHILGFLSPRELLTICLVSKTWDQLASDATLWKEIARRNDISPDHCPGNQTVKLFVRERLKLYTEIRTLYPERIINACGGIESVATLPVTDQANRDDDYIDYLPAKDLKDPVMRGQTKDGRPFIMFKVEVKPNPNLGPTALQRKQEEVKLLRTEHNVTNPYEIALFLFCRSSTIWTIAKNEDYTVVKSYYSNFFNPTECPTREKAFERLHRLFKREPCGNVERTHMGRSCYPTEEDAIKAGDVFTLASK